MEGMAVNSDLLAFYRGRRVFVTGHTGFKGSWLCSILSSAGAEVTGYAWGPEHGSMFERLALDREMHSVTGDVRDLSKLQEAMSAARPEIVFHLAAQPIVLRSYAEPVMTFSTNVMGTVHVLEAVRNTGSVRSAVIITTDKVYENPGQHPLSREDDRLGGHDPYSSSKACAELAVAGYRSSFFADRGVGVATARAGNVIGGGDTAEYRIIPDCVRSVSVNLPVLLRNPDSVRPWQHVLEPLYGYLLLAKKLCEGEDGSAGAFNFGPDARECITTGELAGLFCAEWGGGARWICENGGNAPHEEKRLLLDHTKAKERLGWNPKLTVKQAVALVVEWEKSDDKTAATRSQIERYFES
jgi:CDP-glucose 4,6-dehydratase